MADYAAAYYSWRSAEKCRQESGLVIEDRSSLRPTRGAEKRAAWDDEDEPVDDGELDGDAASDLLKKPKFDEAKDSVAQDVVVRDHVRHEAAVPPGHPYVPISQHQPPKFPAREFPFPLDTFQELAIVAIQREESVLVSAPTSAGKTVVSEYAIAQALQRNQRVIYTSPIKALSNQKYRELSAIFGDSVGLLTGDVTVNKDAGCLVMTTEILQSMLYTDPGALHRCKWVIFDEIHYLRDPTRGVVWEETLILLPSHMRHVFLSATVPNAMEFAQWIIKVHEQPCHIVYTKKRPVPLRHYIQRFPGNGMVLAMDEYGDIVHENLDTVLSKPGQGPHRPLSKRELLTIVESVLDQDEHPVIVFSFGRRTTSEYGAYLACNISLNTPDEAQIVEHRFNDIVMSRLSKDDHALPQVRSCLSLLRRGIAVHHAGILPPLKDAIEKLFQTGLIKILCATETFAMGVNMPARTVIFTSQAKFDGISNRWLSSGEYIQMAGRAGRRGLDQSGKVIIGVTRGGLPLEVARNMLACEADRLDSAFHLGYHMVLKLLGARKLSPEYMLEQSFSQFQATSSLPLLDTDVKVLERQLAETAPDPEMDKYVKLWELSRTLRNQLATLLTGDQNASQLLRFVREGMLVYISTYRGDIGWGIVAGKSVDIACPRSSSLTVHIMCKQRKFRSQRTLEEWETIWPWQKKPQLRTVTFPLSAIRDFSTVTEYPICTAGTKSEKRQLLARILRINEARTPPNYADPVTDMGILAPDVKNLMEQLRPIEQEICRHPVHARHDFTASLKLAYARRELAHQVEDAKMKLEEAKSVKRCELDVRKAILRCRRFIDEDERLTFKGRVGVHFKVKDELVLTELLMDRIFEKLAPDHMVALLSVFVAESDRGPKKFPNKLGSGVLRPYLEHIQRISDGILSQSKELGLPMTDADVRYYRYMASPVLVDAVHAWCLGASFSRSFHIAVNGELGCMEPGDLLFKMRNLEELLDELKMAVCVLGNDALLAKIERGRNMLSRGIVRSKTMFGDENDSYF